MVWHRFHVAYALSRVLDSMSKLPIAVFLLPDVRTGMVRFLVTPVCEPRPSLPRYELILMKLADWIRGRGKATISLHTVASASFASFDCRRAFGLDFRFDFHTVARFNCRRAFSLDFRSPSDPSQTTATQLLQWRTVHRSLRLHQPPDSHRPAL